MAIVAAILLSALSGSAVADAAALTALLLPMMVAAGHDKAQSGGLIAAAGVIGPVIPPSIGFVIFGVAANVSISKLFLAGIFPGILIGASLWLTWMSWCARKRSCRRRARAPRKFWPLVRSATWALMLPVIILVGLRFGVFTPTEAAVVAAVYAFFVATVVYRELKLEPAVRGLRERSQDHRRDHVPGGRGDGVGLADHGGRPAEQGDRPARPFMDNKTLLMIAIMVLCMLVGTAMDMTPTILILTPVLMPVIKQAGIDPVYFGVLFIINNSIGLVTPPVGTVLNVVAGVGRMKMDEVTRGVLPFMLAEFAILFLMVLFPQLVTVPAKWFGG